MGAMASQITSLNIVYSTVYSDAHQRKHQSSASLAFVRGIHRDRWIPRTNGQLRGKCLHLMTSSWGQCSNPPVLRLVGRIRSVPWIHDIAPFVAMHQQPWYWPCSIQGMKGFQLLIPFVSWNNFWIFYFGCVCFVSPKSFTVPFINRSYLNQHRVECGEVITPT